MTSPAPRPGILEIAPYVPGESRAPGGPEADQALLQRDAARPQPQGDRRIQGSRRRARALPRRRGDAPAQRDRRALWARMPRASSAARARTSFSACLAHAYLGPGDEAIFTEHGFLLYRIVALASGATPVVAPETDLRTDVDAILARVTERTKVVFLANPNNPTGTYIADRRGARAAREAARRTCCSCSTPPMPSTCAATTTRPASSSSRTHRQHGDDAHLLQDLRAGRVCGSAGPIARRRWPTCSTASAGRSTSRRPRSPPASPRSRTRRTRRRRRPQRALAAVADDRDREAGAQGDAERRQLRAHAFPEGACAQRTCGRRLPQVARHHRAPRRCLWPARCAAHDHRHRRATIARSLRRSRRFSMEPPHDAPDVRARRADRDRPHRLFDQPRHAPQGPRRAPSSAAPAPRRRVDTALKLGLIDRGYASAAEAVTGADLVILSVPVGACGALAARDRAAPACRAPSSPTSAR